jgi:hypothetical protein
MSRFNRKVDTNHPKIVNHLRACGYQVFDTHALPGRLDIDCLSKSGLIIVPMEIKMPGEKLTEAEEIYLSQWPGYIVHSEDEAQRLMERIDQWRVQTEA